MSRRENYDTVRMLLSAQIASDTHHASHMFQHPPTALRGLGEPVIVHSHDTQRLGHIQHRTNGKNFAGSGAEPCITVLNGLDGPIVL
jgi:hypothetical protein